MMLSHVLEKVRNEPWLITVGGYETVTLLIENKLAGIAPDPDVQREEPPVPWTIDSDGIATIGVNGVLGHRLSSMEKICGGTDYGDIQKATESALNRQARGVLYAFDSSGGMVRGCSELGTYIKGLPVPTMAYTDSKCSSAAYWLASACNQMMSSEMADVGSIGVILPWIDRGKIWETEGRKFEPFTNEGADLKGAGAGPSLTEAQKSYMQDTVNFVGEQFKTFVKSNRAGVKPEVFRAGSYFGRQALDMGLVDAIGGYSDAQKMLLTRCQEPMKVGRPEPTKRIQGKQHMTREELQAQHPELYEQLVQEQESALTAAATTAANNAMAAERTRLGALDALSYNPACEKVVAAAKAGNKQPADIAAEIAAILAKENGELRTQVGVYKGAAVGGRVASIDPTSSEPQGNEEEEMSKRLAATFAKRQVRGIRTINGGKN